MALDADSELLHTRLQEESLAIDVEAAGYKGSAASIARDLHSQAGRKIDRRALALEAVLQARGIERGCYADNRGNPVDIGSQHAGQSIGKPVKVWLARCVGPRKAYNFAMETASRDFELLDGPHLVRDLHHLRCRFGFHPRIDQEQNQPCGDDIERYENTLESRPFVFPRSAVSVREHRDGRQ